MMLRSPILLVLIPLLGACLPTIHIQGELTIRHEVIHRLEKSSNSKGGDLKSWKQAGLVGERYDGYLGLVTPHVDGAVRQELDRINQERKQAFAEIQAKHPALSMDMVQQNAGRTFIQREQPGAMVMKNEGHWQENAR